MNENNSDDKLRRRYPLKAEEMDYETLQGIIPNLEYDGQILESIKNALSEEDKKIVEVWGAKGVGKSAHILGTFARMVEETYEEVKRNIDISDIPVMISFDPTGGKIKIVDPSKYVSEEVLNILREKEYFREEDTDEKKKEWVEKSKVICVDNIHYLAEKVSDNPNAEEMLKEIFEEVLYEVSENRKVIILSTEVPLRLSKLDDKELEELKKEIMEKTGGEIEIRPPSIESLCHVYGVKLDPVVKEWCGKWFDNNPRSFMNLLRNYGDGNVVTAENIIKDNYDDLKGKLLKGGLNDELAEFVLKHPRLPISPQELLDEIKRVEEICGEESDDLWKSSKYKEELEKKLSEIQEELERLWGTKEVNEYMRVSWCKSDPFLKREEKEKLEKRFSELRGNSTVKKYLDLDKERKKIEQLLKELKECFSHRSYKELWDMTKGNMKDYKGALQKIGKYYEDMKEIIYWKGEKIETARKGAYLCYPPLREIFFKKINRGLYFPQMVFS